MPPPTTKHYVWLPHLPVSRDGPDLLVLLTGQVLQFHYGSLLAPEHPSVVELRN